MIFSDYSASFDNKNLTCLTQNLRLCIQKVYITLKSSNTNLTIRFLV